MCCVLEFAFDPTPVRWAFKQWSDMVNSEVLKGDSGGRGLQEEETGGREARAAVVGFMEMTEDTKTCQGGQFINNDST